MLYLFKFLLFLINIDQETVLNWFVIENPATRQAQQLISDTDNYGFRLPNNDVKLSTDISMNTFRLLIEGLGDKIQDGLTLADIENILFFILFVRFIILAIRYNLKTSFYITCIGLFAGYLWYRHVIDLISMYRIVLLKLPYLQKLGIDSVQLRSLNRQMPFTDLKLEENAHWYNPGQIIYSAFIKGIINTDPETDRKYYIDPVSMLISKFQEFNNSNILSLHYKLYHKIIPKIYEICSKCWAQFSGVAAYTVITRIGKRYCPYLVRWHWTFLLIIGMIEQIFVYFIYRVYYFQTFVLIPQLNSYDNSTDLSLAVQLEFLNFFITSILLTHIGFIIFGLFHAIWGQYFYLPFFVENTELHVGPRPRNSIYSGGNTAWQDSEEKEKNLNRTFPQLWYGWFGRGTKNYWQIQSKFKKFINKIFKKFKK
jgi:hypothetical protein